MFYIMRIGVFGCWGLWKVLSLSSLFMPFTLTTECRLTVFLCPSIASSGHLEANSRTMKPNLFPLFCFSKMCCGIVLDRFYPKTLELT
jgi:hypothetical protein